MVKAWVRYDRNVQLEMDGWHISYNRDTGGTPFGRFFEGDEPEETALAKDGKYFILNGDWRDEYEKIVEQGFYACYEFYQRHKAVHGSTWSNADLELTPRLGTAASTDPKATTGVSRTLEQDKP